MSPSEIVHRLQWLEAAIRDLRPTEEEKKMLDEESADIAREHLYDDYGDDL